MENALHAILTNPTAYLGLAQVKENIESTNTYVLSYNRFSSVSKLLLIACTNDGECTDPTKPNCIQPTCTGKEQDTKYKRTKYLKKSFAIRNQWIIG